ncbi:Glycerophosphodiester phosphodiesterase gde1 [Zostera marina]|uniref:glycerophosphodiester phosphodiesterase n=1 Tax=Zostera marina TaxID=29655 RepID=A0A0K9PDE2_ZOSMR|nr:Glycerophosphodiester phosphodiesterase gde1 [Zostera marina]
MAVKAVHASSEMPKLDLIQENPTVSIVTSPRQGLENGSFKKGKFSVIGHRGTGMNLLTSAADGRFKAIKENSIRSFNQAATLFVDFIEFDVQVTKDGHPIVFHDNFIIAEENGSIYEHRVTELDLEEFLSYGPQKDSMRFEKPLQRKSKDGRIGRWSVEEDDCLCTLEEVFLHVHPRLGFNIELKFDDHLVYSDDQLTCCLRRILNVVFEHSNNRNIFFSSFQPDAALLMRKLQSVHPVYFLTNGGNQVFSDTRRNSLDEALKHCLASDLQGIVSEVRGLFRNPALIPRIKESNLAILTYGQLNNVSEAVYMQHLMGVDGVIVDFVKEITDAVSDFVGETRTDTTERPEFSQSDLKFLLKLIPKLIQQ